MGYELAASSRNRSANRVDDSSAYTETSRDRGSRLAASAGSSYRLDAAQSKFIAHAFAGGLFLFKGHEHLVAMREFNGEGLIDPGSPNSFSVNLHSQTSSMEGTTNHL